MTAPFIPPIARQPKPERVRYDHPRVTGAQLAHIPGKRGLPLFGILPEAVLDPLAFATRMYERYGPVHRFYACGNWNVQLIGPEANEFVLFDQQENFSAEGGWRPVFGRHFDGGLLLRDGADHHWHRKLIASAFKQEHLQAYAQMFARNAAGVVEKWAGKPFDVYEVAQELSFANGYSAFLGGDPAKATRKDMLAFRYLMRSATSVVPLPFPGTAEGHAQWADRHVERLMRSRLQEPIRADRNDLLAVLSRLVAAQILTQDEMLAHLKFVVAAAFDALSSATLSTLYYLAQAPEWQGDLREELCSGIPDLSEVGLSSVARCVRSEWAIKEALRLNAAAPVLWRRAVKDFGFAGQRFPAGTVTGVNPMLTHLLPEVWERPLRFDPLRHSPDAAKSRHRYSFVPFGGGAHGCLGANYAYIQIRILLRCLLEKHELTLGNDRAPSWYHWPNCRPRRKLILQLEPKGSL